MKRLGFVRNTKCSHWEGKGGGKGSWVLCCITQKSGKPFGAAAWHQSIPSALWSARASIFTPFSNKVFSCISILPSSLLSTINFLLHLLHLIKNTRSCLWCEAYNRTAVTGELAAEPVFPPLNFHFCSMSSLSLTLICQPEGWVGVLAKPWCVPRASRLILPWEDLYYSLYRLLETVELFCSVCV